MDEIVNKSLNRIEEKSNNHYLKRLDHLEKQLKDLETELNSIIILNNG